MKSYWNIYDKLLVWDGGRCKEKRWEKIIFVYKNIESVGIKRKKKTNSLF